MNGYMTPDPIDTVCFHLQHGTSGGNPKAYEFTHSMFGKTITSLEYFKAYYDASKSLNKAVFFGEFGDFRDMEGDEACAENFETVVGWIEESGIQIGALWQFQDYTNEGVSGQKLEVLSKVNTRLVSEGKQNTEIAWSDKTAVTTAPATTQEQISTDTTGKTDETSGNNESGKIKLLLPVILAGVAVVGIVAAVTVIINAKKKK